MKIQYLLFIPLFLFFLTGCSSGSASVSTSNASILISPPADNQNVTITSPLSNEGELETVNRPQIKLPRSLEFSQVTSGLINVNQSASLNDKYIMLESGHGIIAGDRLALFEGTRVYGGFVTGVSGQNISLDTPLDYNFSLSAASVTLNRDMNVDGSTIPQIFQIGTVADLPLQITRINFAMTDGSSGDDTTFGGCPALTNGIVLRFIDGAWFNIFNVKTNGDLRKVAGGDFIYSDKAGGGAHGFSSRVTFNGQDKMDTVIEVMQGEQLQIIIQDDLTCLTSFDVTAQGNADFSTLFN